MYYDCYYHDIISWLQLVSREVSDSLTGNQQSRSVGIADAPFTSSALSRQQSSSQKTSEDQYMACESRVSNFTRSWPRTAGNLTPQHMALAGFFYTGELKNCLQYQDSLFRCRIGSCGCPSRHSTKFSLATMRGLKVAQLIMRTSSCKSTLRLPL